MLIEVEDPEAFWRYQAFHNQTCGHVVQITSEPLWDMDQAFEETIRDLKCRSGDNTATRTRCPSRTHPSPHRSKALQLEGFGAFMPSVGRASGRHEGW